MSSIDRSSRPEGSADAWFEEAPTSTDKGLASLPRPSGEALVSGAGGAPAARQLPITPPPTGQLIMPPLTGGPVQVPPGAAPIGAPVQVPMAAPPLGLPVQVTFGTAPIGAPMQLPISSPPTGAPVQLPIAAPRDPHLQLPIAPPATSPTLSPVIPGPPTPAFVGAEIPGEGVNAKGRSWGIVAAASVVSLAVGIGLGALLFRGGSGAGGAAGGGAGKPGVAAPATDCAASPTCPPAPTCPVAVAAAAGEAAPRAVASSGLDASPASGGPIAVSTPDGGAGGLGLGGCSAKLSSSPSGATVTVEGVAAGSSPLDLRGLPCDRPVLIRVEKDLFEVWQRKATFKADKVGRVFAELKRPQVAIAISSKPAGAEVSIGGRVAGKTPLSTTVSAWVNTSIVVSLTGYKPYATSVRARQGKPLNVSATLEKAPKPTRGGTTTGTGRTASGGSTTGSVKPATGGAVKPGATSTTTTKRPTTRTP